MITLEIAAPEFVKRFQAGEIPGSAHVTVTYEPANGVAMSGSIWDEDIALAGAELEAERQLYEQFERNINAERSARTSNIVAPASNAASGDHTG